MPTIVVKPERNHDLYVLWSTVVDNWVFIGNREDTKAELEGEQYGREAGEIRLVRADQCGSSALYCDPPAFSWATNGMIVANMKTFDTCRWLPRERLLAYCEAVLFDHVDLAEALTEECED